GLPVVRKAIKPMANQVVLLEPQWFILVNESDPYNPESYREADPGEEASLCEGDEGVCAIKAFLDEDNEHPRLDENETYDEALMTQIQIAETGQANQSFVRQKN